MSLASPEFTSYQQALANSIWESRAFKTGAFKLKLHETRPDAPLSPVYISLRERDVLPGTYPDLRDRIVDAILENCAAEVYWSKYVIGIPKAGDPIAERAASILGLPLLIMVKEETTDKRRVTSIIIGNFRAKGEVFGLDDLISEANTKLEFIEALAINKLKLKHLAVAVDREQGGIELLKEKGVSVSASIKISQLLNYYRSSNRIDESTFDQISTYIASSRKV